MPLVEQRRSDVLVVGAGIAGLMAALKLAPAKVTVLCKTRLGKGAATDWAQGGIAAAMGDDDSPRLHAIDTQRAGAGISDANDRRDPHPRRARAGGRAARARRRHSIATEGGELALGREAAHQRRRIVKAGGDATGHEILKTLIDAVARSSVDRDRRERDGAAIFSSTTIESPAFAPARTRRAIVIDFAAAASCSPPAASAGSIATRPIRCKRPATASRWPRVPGRCSPTWSSCSSIRRRSRSDATRCRWSPRRCAARERSSSTISASGSCSPCIPMPNSARATSSPARSSSSCSADAPSASTRAPRSARIFPEPFRPSSAFACEAGIDPRVQNIPVAPAAHYHMGGIAVDEWGRTSLRRLWACGETSATGVHGANRLASNSLLEALVYGSRVATDVAAMHASIPPLERTEEWAGLDAAMHAFGMTEAQAITDLRNVMYANVGLVRNDAGLREALSAHCRTRGRTRRGCVDAAQSARRRTFDHRGGARAPRKSRQPLSKRLPAGR